MKTFYEMLQLLENSSVRESSYAEEKAVYEKIEKSLKQAGLPWDEDEFNVLYGKLVDMTVWTGPNKEERIQGFIYPDDFEQDEDSIRPRAVGFQVLIGGSNSNSKRFDPTSIVEIHGIKSQMTYQDILDDWNHERDYDRTRNSLPY